MNKKKLEELKSYIDILPQIQKKNRLHQVLEKQQHLPYASKHIFQYLTPKQRILTSMISKDAKSLYDKNIQLLQTLNVSESWNILYVIQFILPRMKNLKKLDLTHRIRNRDINNKYCKALNLSLPYLQNLNTLILSDNGLSINDIRLIQNGLQHLSHLRYLNISYNALTIKGTSFLFSILSKLSNLEYLNLQSNFYPLLVLNKELIQIENPLLKLKYLILNKNILYYQQFDFFQKLPNLQTLSLIDCRIDDETLIRLVHNLKNLKKLKILILDENPITDIGLILEHLSFIQILSIKSTNISKSMIQKITQFQIKI
jgi:hypothetical protein